MARSAATPLPSSPTGVQEQVWLSARRLFGVGEQLVEPRREVAELAPTAVPGPAAWVSCLEDPFDRGGQPTEERRHSPAREERGERRAGSDGCSRDERKEQAQMGEVVRIELRPIGVVDDERRRGQSPP